MSQVRWKYTEQWIWHEEEQEEQFQSLQMPCPIPAPQHSHLSCACRNQLLNLKQPESSFETTAKPLGYVCARGGREHIPSLSFSFSCSPGCGEQLWHPPDSAYIPICLLKTAGQQL